MFFLKLHKHLGPLITHITGIKGDITLFQSWVARSNVVRFQKGNLSFKEPNTQHHFVFGGNFGDGGSGELGVANSLVKFKTQNPRQVTLIASGADIAKRRFTYELHPDTIKQRLLSGEGVFWNKKSTPQNYLYEQHVKKAIHNNTDYHDIERYLDNKTEGECQTIYLKWMLKETMGSNSFEFRRQELALSKMIPIGQVSDDMVTQSFIQSVSPTGIVTNFLKNSQIAAVLGDTLFIHGAVTPENIGYIPNTPKTRVRCAKEWIAGLNDWYTGRINDWLNHPYEQEVTTPGNKELDHYSRYDPKSVVSSTWLRKGKLVPPNDQVAAFLNKAGIYRVVCGNNPTRSDLPIILRHANLEVLIGDTSSSDLEAKEDTRGHALHNLEIHQQPQHSFAHIDAIRKDASQVEFKLPAPQNHNPENALAIGDFTEDNKLIRPGKKGELVCCHLDGDRFIDEPFEQKTSSGLTCRS